MSRKSEIGDEAIEIYQSKGGDRGRSKIAALKSTEKDGGHSESESENRERSILEMEVGFMKKRLEL